MSIAKHTSYNIAGALVPMAVSIVTVPLYLKAVGIERYGVLALCWLILGFVGFLNLGMGPAVAQRLASMAEASDDERERVFWSGVWLSFAMGGLGALLVLLLGRVYFEQLSGASSAFTAEIHQALPWLALMMPLVLVSGVLTGALQGRARFLAMNAVNSSASVLMSLLPLAVAWLIGPRLDGLIAAAMAGRAITFAFAFAAVARAVPLRRLRRPEPQLMRRLAAFGGWVTITSLIVPIVATLDRFLIGGMLGAAAVSIYAIPYNLVSRIGIVPTSLASALFPRFAGAAGAEADDLLAEGAAALVSLLTPLAILIIAALGPFLHLWIGQDLGALAAPVGYVLVGGFWVNSTAQLPYAFLESRGRPDLNAKLHLAYVVPYLTLLYFALQALGVLGAAAAWSLRSCFDPTLYALAGSFRRIVPSLAPGAVLVVLAMAAALIFPWTSPVHWLLLAALFGLSLLLAVRLMPSSVRAQLRRLGSFIPATDRQA
jgi:O-antigen/teichoic acid export membrane protein